jgi:hypothetical protein
MPKRRVMIVARKKEYQRSDFCLKFIVTIFFILNEDNKGKLI